MKKITITIEDDSAGYDRMNSSNPFDHGFPSDGGWVGGRDICATCPNRPYGPNNKEGFCMCAIPSLYGPNRVVC